MSCVVEPTIKEEPKKNNKKLLFIFGTYIVIMIIVIAGMYIFVNSATSIMKIERYDAYEPYLKQIAECRTIPMIMCNKWNETKEFDINEFNTTKQIPLR